jgi:hypothetical protein
VPLWQKRGEKMKKLILFIIIVLFFSVHAFSQGNLKFLKIEVPTEGKTKNRLLFDLEDIKKMLDELKLEELSANINFTDLGGYSLATLGKIKKGKIDWSHKIVDEKSLLVKFKKDDYSMVIDKVKEKSRNPGFQIQIVEVKFDILSTKRKLDRYVAEKAKFKEAEDAVSIYEITFAEFMDLTADMKYPIKATPGEELGKKVSVKVKNKGTNAAKNFNVELVLSSDNQIPVKPAPYSENFSEDILLKDGRKSVELLNSGEDITLSFDGSIKIPADTPPGRYYLGAVIDPENKIEEINKKNNIFARFIIISLPAPKRLILNMPDTHLIYEPESFGLKIECLGVTLSEGKDWRKCRLKPYVQQLKHISWKDFHWDVDSIERGVWKVKGLKFCTKVGKGEEIKMKMEVKGGSRLRPPYRITLGLSKTQLEFEPSTHRFKLSTFGCPIVYIPFWKVARIEANLYQFRHTLWKDFYWEVDTFKKEVNRITGGQFGKKGGTSTSLDINVTVEE